MSEGRLTTELCLLSGEGTVTLREDSGGLHIEMFQQDTMSETLSFADRNKIIRWLVGNAYKEGEA